MLRLACCAWLLLRVAAVRPALAGPTKQNEVLPLLPGRASHADCDSYQLGCRWTVRLACPGAPQPGLEGFAKPDGSLAFECCCGEQTDVVIPSPGVQAEVASSPGIRLPSPAASALDEAWWVGRNVSLTETRTQSAFAFPGIDQFVAEPSLSSDPNSTLYVVLTFTAAGSVDDYNSTMRAAVGAAVASASGQPNATTYVAVTPGSVLVEVDVVVPSASANASYDSVRAALASAETASALLGVELLSTPNVTLVAALPSPPPPLSPRFWGYPPPAPELTLGEWIWGLASQAMALMGGEQRAFELLLVLLFIASIALCCCTTYICCCREKQPEEDYVSSMARAASAGLPDYITPTSSLKPDNLPCVWAISAYIGREYARTLEWRRETSGKLVYTISQKSSSRRFVEFFEREHAIAAFLALRTDAPSITLRVVPQAVDNQKPPLCERVVDMNEGAAAREAVISLIALAESTAL